MDIKDTMGMLPQLPFWVVESRESSHDHGGNAFAGRLYIHCKKWEQYKLDD